MDYNHSGSLGHNGNLIIFVTANIYRNDGELLNPPEEADAAGILTGHTTYSTVASP